MDRADADRPGSRSGERPAPLDGTVPEAGRPRRLVLVPVGRLDRRAIRSLEVAGQVPAADRRALHVAAGRDALWEFGQAWMAHGLPMPVSTVDAVGSVAATVGQVVRTELAGGYDEVVVVVGRLALGPLFGLLHHRTADAIARQLAGVTGAVVAFSTITVG